MTLHRWRSSRGSELVEFALGSTVFFLTLFGILQGGITIWRYNNLAFLAQEGARYASVRGVNTDSTMRAQGTTTAIRTYVQSRALGAVPTVTVSPTNPNTLAAGATVTVTVSQAIVSVSYLPWSGTMTASSTMAMLR